MKKDTILTYFIIVKYKTGLYGVEKMGGTVRVLQTLNLGYFKNIEDAKKCATEARDEYIAKCEKAGCFRDGQNPKDEIKLSYTVWGNSYFDDIVDNIPKLDQIDETNIS